MVEIEVNFGCITVFFLVETYLHAIKVVNVLFMSSMLMFH